EDVAGGRIHGDSYADVTAAAAEVGGPEQGAAVRAQPRHVGVVKTVIGRLQRVGSREVGRNGIPRDEGVASGRVHGDPIAKVTAAAAEVGGPEQGAAVRTQPRHEGVVETA